MPILVVLFIVVPIAEIYVIIKIGGLIGVLPTLALLVADALLGSLLLRQQGRAAWRRFSAAIGEGRFPGREAADGVMVAVGATLLLTPGFITDVVGLLLLIPPTRALIRGMLFRYLRRRVVVVGAGGDPYGRGEQGPSRQGPAGGRPYDFEGSARDVPADQEMPANGGREDSSRKDPDRPHLPPP
jgi:UPF0716 protein FxsA